MNTLTQPPPLLVTGPGRTGTSAVAKALHQAGIHMGRGWPSPPPNRAGTYEDAEFHQRVFAFTAGAITEHTFREYLRDERTRHAGVTWGRKDPRLTECIDVVLDEWPDAAWVWCHRRAATAASSWSRWYHMARPRALETIRTRMQAFERIRTRGVGPYAVVDMNTWREADEILAFATRPLGYCRQLAGEELVS